MDGGFFLDLNPQWVWSSPSTSCGRLWNMLLFIVALQKDFHWIVEKTLNIESEIFYKLVQVLIHFDCPLAILSFAPYHYAQERQGYGSQSDFFIKQVNCKMIAFGTVLVALNRTREALAHFANLFNRRLRLTVSTRSSLAEHVERLREDVYSRL